MSLVTFKRDMKNAATILDKVDAYTNEFEISLRLNSGDLGESKDIGFKTLNFDAIGECNPRALRVIKVRIDKKHFNLSITDDNNTTQSEIEGITRFKSHYILYIGDNTFTIFDCFNNCYMTIGETEIKDIKHLSRSYPLYSICTKMLIDSTNNLISEGPKPRESSIITDYSGVGFEVNKIYNMDCMDAFKKIGDNSVDFVLTDIPYNSVNRFDSSKNRINSKAMRNLDLGNADIITFELKDFLKEAVRVTSNSICIFCGYNQISEICNFFTDNKLTTRLIVWEKTHFSPMNGNIVYGTNVEIAVWGKKHNNGVFNAFCKGTVFKYGSGSSKVHPTQKNVDLFKELILDNTNQDMLVLDPCIGSGTTALACMLTGRKFIGFEKNEKWCNVANEAISKYIIPD